MRIFLLLFVALSFISCKKEQPFTLMAKNALAGLNGNNFDGYNDYRGVPVVGAWIWESNIGYGISTEMDYSEAYRSTAQIRKQTYTGIAVTIVLILLLTTLFIRNRIRSLYQNTKLEKAKDIAVNAQKESEIINEKLSKQEEFVTPEQIAEAEEEDDDS